MSCTLSSKCVTPNSEVSTEFLEISINMHEVLDDKMKIQATRLISATVKDVRLISIFLFHIGNDKVV